ncbi:hypothetical protein AB1L88_26220 [Tautonia sp. JC769]|uniref:hypothetical protein n=1 Tax=Tautonia sp. JC769 TaxID=3232135 RepID=UPI003457C1AE
MSRVVVRLSLAAIVCLPLMSGCGSGATQTGTAPEAHSPTVGGHGAVSGAAGPEAPGGGQ